MAAGAPRVPYEQVEVCSAAELRAWLAAHHHDVRGIWLVTWKKAAHPDRHVTYEELVREALCFGWIDSQAKGVDAERASIQLTPRHPRSGWSRTNKVRVEELTAAGLMEPAGLAAVEAAKASGAWTLLDDAENLTEPDDLRAALDAEPAARRHWNAFPRSPRRALLIWVTSAKRPATREHRVAEVVARAAENVRANGA